MAGPMFIVDFEPHYGEMDVSPLPLHGVSQPVEFTFHGTGTYVIGEVTWLSLIRGHEMNNTSRRCCRRLTASAFATS